MKRELPDADLRAIEAQFAIGEPKEMRCENGNKIEEMCITAQCQKEALLCSQKGCKQCNKDAHRRCYRISLSGEEESSVTSLLRKKAEKEKKFMVEIQ